MTTDEGMKFAYIDAAIEETPYWDPMSVEEAEATWDEWIARVKRDAALEALDGLADEAIHVNWEMDGPSFALRVRRFKNRKYPEKED